jgi:L-histidine Nalpha-methyltransferase
MSEHPTSASTDGYEVLQGGAADTPEDEFALHVLVGLGEEPKRLSSRYFYDDHGSELFAAITDQEDYYLTSAEQEILEANRARITGMVADHPFNLVDLGAGDGRKTFTVIEHLASSQADFRYVPIDISEGAMKGLVKKTRARFPDISVGGLVSEYFSGIRWLGQETGRRNLVLFLGSNIGNFSRGQAREFLRRLWNALQEDDYVLVGFDMKKDIDTLLRAYNDRAGKTRDFNLNLLARINQQLGANFDLNKFQHFSTYNVMSGAMESFLVSREHQKVWVAELEREFSFKPYEPIHTEYSCKYLMEDITGLAGDTGFEVDATFFDAQQRFCDALWRVKKTARKPRLA